MSEHIVPIPADDQERIDAKVQEFRHALELFYQLGHLQGQKQANVETLKMIRGENV